MENKVILVDIFDNEIGECEKFKAHKSPVLHRAFSIFLFNDNKLLLQKRAKNKYHSGGLWTNSCCSHPSPGSPLLENAQKRLEQELGIKDVPLTELFSFTYMAKFSENLFEYEFDHVLIGQFCGKVKPNKEEASHVKWVDIDNLSQDLRLKPEKYTSWFHICAPRVISYLKSQNAK